LSHVIPLTSDVCLRLADFSRLKWSYGVEYAQGQGLQDIGQSSNITRVLRRPNTENINIRICDILGMM
jgi:hypothetical protein